VIAFTVLYILVTAIASEVFSFTNEGGGALIFKKTRKAKKMVNAESKVSDEEKGAAPPETVSSGSSETMQDEKDNIVNNIAESKSVFTLGKCQVRSPVSRWKETTAQWR
jgi:hypothetical protein